MSNDLTLLYYTANKIPDITGERVRDHLLKITGNKFPIISVSQKPIKFGKNFCVGDIGRSHYNCYKQIFVGVSQAKTKYVACCEDDTLYSLEHFNYRPKDNIYAYECNMWFLENKIFWRREQKISRTGMFGCVVATKTLFDTLNNRFKKFPSEPIPNNHFWVEPGRFEGWFGRSREKTEMFESKDPLVVFRYAGSMGGLKRHERLIKPENRTNYLEQFGDAEEAWKKYWLK